MLFSICLGAKKRIGKGLEGGCRDLVATAILTIAGRLSKFTIHLHSTTILDAAIQMWYVPKTSLQCYQYTKFFDLIQKGTQIGKF
jgi:hypothetical protein